MLANAILFLHLCVVLFLSINFFLIPLGGLRNWLWVRNLWFRSLHLGLIILIFIETIFGIACPLTLIEKQLRSDYSEISFMEYWVHKLIYYDFPNHFFIFIYLICCVWTISLWKIVPPTTRIVSPTDK